MGKITRHWQLEADEFAVNLRRAKRDNRSHRPRGCCVSRFFFSDKKLGLVLISTSTLSELLFLTMSTAVEAPRQFKQPSRKGKKAWRKNVDVTEVQEGLRQLTDAEIQG